MVLTVLLLAAQIQTTVPARAEVIDRVLAVVSGDVILLSDVVLARELGLIAPAGSDDPVRAALEALIDRALVLAEVDRYSPSDPSQSVIDRELQELIGRFPNAQVFETTIARVGFEVRHLREWLRQDLRIQAYLDQRFVVVPPAEDDLATFYREHAGRFSVGGALTPFEQARSLVVQSFNAERRGDLVDAWVSSLRRRADIQDLYDSPPPP